VVRAADPPSQLVQLREAERSARSITIVLAVGMSMPLSMMVVHMSTLLRAVVEIQHHLLEFAFAHLAVPDHDPRLRHQRRKPLWRRALSCLDAVVHVVHLAAAAQLAQTCLAHLGAFHSEYEGLDRQPRSGRRRDQRQVPQATESHVERSAGIGVCGQREHVDLGAHLLQAFLVAYTEAMLLIDDQESRGP
jgi:hypothetical protein